MRVNDTDEDLSVLAWDWPTRLFHWALVAAIVSAWFSTRYAETLGDATLQWHRYNGYAVLILLVFRVIWGFIGPSTARWKTFVRGPGAAIFTLATPLAGASASFSGTTP